MGRVLCWSWTNSALVCIIVAFVLGACVVQSGISRNAVWVVILYSPCAVQTHHNDDDGSGLIFVGCMYAWNGYWLWPNSAYVCIAVCVLEFDGVTGVQWMRHEIVIVPFMLSKYTTHYNHGDGGSALIFDPWMYYRTGVVLALDKQCVRLHCLNLTRVIAVWRHNNLTIIICHVLSKNTTMAMPVLRWSSLVECMWWMSCWP